MSKKDEGDAKSRTRKDSPQGKVSPASKSDKRDPAEQPDSFAPIPVDKHRQLAGNQRKIFERINSTPELSKLFFINPALALKELGVELSPEMTHHVLNTVRHPPGLLKRREELEQKLTEALKEKPQPNSSEWVSEILFNRLKLTPLDTAHHQPKYLEPLNSKIVRHLQDRRPKLRQRPADERPRSGTVLSVARWRPAVRRMDLNADLPQLEPLKEAPPRVTLKELYFYKDINPIARDLLELGIIQRRGFPIHSADTYRKIKRGEKRNAFYTWIKNVRFSEKPKK